MNSSRKSLVVLVFVLEFGRAAPDNQWDGRGLLLHQVPLVDEEFSFLTLSTLWPL
jgi:hypothetical protein